MDTGGVKFYRDALTLLRERMHEVEALQFTELDNALLNDDVALSRHIRDLRLNGSNKLSPDQVAVFCRKNGLDHALSSSHWGGLMKMDDSLFMNSQWDIYDAQGKLVVSVFTRSKYDQTSPDDMDQKSATQTLLALYKENLEKFLNVLKTGGKQ